MNIMNRKSLAKLYNSLTMIKLCNHYQYNFTTSSSLSSHIILFYEKGLEVVGVEFVEKPVKKFFTQHNLKYEVKEIDEKTTLDKRLKIYVSDFLDVHANDIGKFDVIWDRLAQVALEPCNREKYSNLMKTLCKDEFTYFLFTLQFEKPGNPDIAPISVSHEESKKMYGGWCKMKFVFQKDAMEDIPFVRRSGIEEIFENESSFLKATSSSTQNGFLLNHN
ncbi:Thiopurine S-methyltransferase [Armadillidium vulgare]|nr:Thiopurine S-methyltransferase [Armadillidium vulgare]